MTKRFKLRLSQLGNGMITDTQKREDLYFDKEFLDVTLPEVNEWLNELDRENKRLKKENEQLKYKINDLLYQIEYVGKNNKSCDGCECFLEDIGYCWMWDMNVKKEDIVVACDQRKVKNTK